ncbi:hypothetical protein [Enterobacter sp. CC120223-11]|uniref:hypothetical protein n=1 Tax=Enterobacter sp. CC120223-11 TaxID=1378073 RepID=UPI000BCFFC53|nr:hypothetical protein [Enterobacter sp. CC120223-11]SNY65820.1 hypothetical protein SAMN02744775_01424 [Enterobacter sp. CC120223-11]
MRLYRRRLKRIFISILKAMTAIIILLTPIALYLSKFNNGLSINNQDWGAFGSYVGGIYAPLAAIISVFILVKTLHSMDSHNKAMQAHLNRDKELGNIKWLTDLLRSMLDKKYETGHNTFYSSLKSRLEHKLRHNYNPDSAIIKNEAMELMDANKELFINESIIFNDLFYRVTHIDDTNDGAISSMILIAKLSPEERFWLMQYAKAHEHRAAKDLRFWNSFEDLPASFSSLLKS